MNYQRVYNQLIAKAQARSNIVGYSERHHIMPKSLGGSDAFDNLVKLTAREHFIAHYLLAKIHGSSQWLSIIRMRGSQKERYINSKLYEIAKRKHAQALSQAKKGVPRTAAQKQRISLGLKGNQNAKGTVRADAMKERWHLANKGKIPWNKGKVLPKHSSNTIEKMRIARTEFWARRKEAQNQVTR